ncbi:hypothetical protein MTR_7g034070 [Medicago truncatula]|uniref:Uncharacterized protein n=1 Tax=Medicago truncatula TaxID=3880 RepID=A0A072TXL8_MEDTR|nr:hypothetical protein MTR_7g034070 [Medicago truncatula]
MSQRPPEVTSDKIKLGRVQSSTSSHYEEYQQAQNQAYYEELHQYHFDAYQQHQYEDHQYQSDIEQEQPDIEQPQQQEDGGHAQGVPVVEYEAGPNGYGGGRFVSTLLPHFSRHVASKIWVDVNLI